MVDNQPTPVASTAPRRSGRSTRAPDRYDSEDYDTKKRRVQQSAVVYNKIARDQSWEVDWEHDIQHGISMSDWELGPEQGICHAAPESRVKSWEIRTPTTYKDALLSPQKKDQWLDAMAKQVGQYETTQTYTKVPRTSVPMDVRILPGKWVFITKNDKYDYVIDYKARWVVCGNRQQPGIDFTDSPSGSII